MTKETAEKIMDEKIERARVWTSILYPESMPDNYLDILSNMQIPLVLSPLHDLDLQSDGSLKKPHYHLIIMYCGKKSYSQVCNDLSPLCGTIPQRVRDTRSTVRYLIHKDNPEKAQYLINDIKLFGGVSIRDYFTDKINRDDLFEQIVDFIESEDITEFCDLVTYTRYNKPEWRDIVFSSYTIFFNSYLTSRRNKIVHTER